MKRGINDYLTDFTTDTDVTTKDLQDMQEVISMLPKGYGEGGDWVNRVFEAYENGFSEGEEAAKSGADERIRKALYGFRGVGVIKILLMEMTIVDL